MAPLDALARTLDPESETLGRVAALNLRYGQSDAHAAISLAVDELFPERIALVSSFGA